MDGAAPQRRQDCVGTVLAFPARTGGVMTLPPASRVAELLKARFPASDIDVMQESDILRIEVRYRNASSLFAVIGDERSLLLVALGASPEPSSSIPLSNERGRVTAGCGETSPDGMPRPCTSLALCVASDLVSQAVWAAQLARTLLEVPLPRRWAHVQGVAGQARSLAPILGGDAELLEASAWLHDIGYSLDLVDTGFHPLDGARYLRDGEHADRALCSLVAYHSCAIIEAEERGLAAELSAEFESPDARLADALAYCDMTTTPAGNVVSVNDRISEIAERYGPHSVVTRFIRKAEPSLISSVLRTNQRLCLAH
ncbi:HD domain-containing protein [Trebonia sp.]|uniref:HD domain-containing protein n=1 Tax=Trebonia sp. TaxID=2767075 RepID=UPI00345B7E4C